MPKKKRKKKPRLTKEQRTRKKRAERIAIRRIAKEEGITQKEARKLYKDAVVEVLFTRPRKAARRNFIEIAPRKFREIPPGKPIREIYAVGPVLSVGDVSRAIKMRQYWELVNILSDEKKMSIKAVRRGIKTGKFGIWDLYPDSKRKTRSKAA